MEEENNEDGLEFEEENKKDDEKNDQIG